MFLQCNTHLSQSSFAIDVDFSIATPAPDSFSNCSRFGTQCLVRGCSRISESIFVQITLLRLEKRTQTKVLETRLNLLTKRKWFQSAQIFTRRYFDFISARNLSYCFYFQIEVATNHWFHVSLHQLQFLLQYIQMNQITHFSTETTDFHRHTYNNLHSFENGK